MGPPASGGPPFGGTRRDDLWRDRAGFRSGSLAQSGPARGTSGRIGGQRGQWDALATSCVRGEVGRRRPGRVRPAWVQRRAGSGASGEGGGVGEILGLRGAPSAAGILFPQVAESGRFRHSRVPTGTFSVRLRYSRFAT